MKKRVKRNEAQEIRKYYSYTSLCERYSKKDRVFKVLVLLSQGKRKRYSAIGEENIKKELPAGQKVWSCRCLFMSHTKKVMPSLTYDEMVVLFGKENVLPPAEKQKNLKLFQESKPVKENIFDYDIKILHIETQLPNGEKKGEQVFIRHKEENWVTKMRERLHDGILLRRCTGETADGYQQKLTDGEMVALFGKENVITKEDKQKIEAQKRWEKHCIKKGWEVRPPADKYL